MILVSVKIRNQHVGIITPGADSPRELEAKAAKIQKDYIDGKR